MDVLSFIRAKTAQSTANRAITGFKKGTMVQTFLDVSNWIYQATAGSQATDTDTGKLKLTADGTGPAFTRKGVNLDLSGSKVLKVSIYVENVANLSQFVLYFANDTGYTNFLAVQVNGSQCVEGWNEFYLDTSKFSVTGTGTLSSDIVSMQVRVEATAATASVVWDSLQRDETQKPQVIFTFDDGWESQYTEAFSYLNKKGFPGLISVIPSIVNSTGNVTLAQLQEMYNYGWDLANHTYDHTNLSTVDTATAKSEISQGQDWLLQNGFTRAANIVIYPQGGFPTDMSIMNSYRAARSIVESIEPGAPSQKYKIKIKNLINTVSVAEAEASVDETINTGGTLIFLNHKLVTSPTVSTEYAIADFQSIVDYVYTKKDQIDVITMTEYLSRYGL